MKQLYIVELNQELLVVAEGEAKAEAFALEALRAGRADWSEGINACASKMNYLPGDWDLECIPYGFRDETERDRTVGGWIKCGAAPFYVSKNRPLT